MRGLIALDIDGTITYEHRDVPARVIEFFQNIQRQGYIFAFITGRTFSWGYQVLKELKIPYYLCVNNGAVILSMPGEKIEGRNYIDPALFPAIGEICGEHRTDFVIYTGYEGEDRCYYRPKRFEETLGKYLEVRSSKIGEKWDPVENFDHLQLSSIASIKCFGKQDDMIAISQEMESTLNLHMPVIRDPHDPNYYVAQATHPNATKGAAISHLRQKLALNNAVIAAGDDINDISMLQEADIRIVMENAPDEVRALADIIAPSASREGIIDGLSQALKKENYERF
jgi:Cof subfamily protein (haloacid dehalogenase superfamily)